MVIGVHTPEFPFEHEVDLVRRATIERGIDYPVAIDNNYEIWSAFENHYWPALYFVDRDGIIRDHHFGEGRYEESERVLQRLLDVEREPVSIQGGGVEAEADWDHLYTRDVSGIWTQPARCLHSGRFGERSAPSQAICVSTTGPSTASGRSERSVMLDQAGGSIAYRYQARDAHLVLSPGNHEPIPFRVTVDGEPPGESHGVDVDEDGNGLLQHGVCTSSFANTTRYANGSSRSRSTSPESRRTFTFG